MTTINPLVQKLTTGNENIWMRLGAISELMHDPDKAMYSYENALRHNLYNIKALTQMASICRLREQYPKAVEYFQRILNIENSNGEIWGALGHCYLMMDDLQKAYAAYQQALYHLPNPKDPNLWYGIGILYDRYGSFEHAEEAFTAVLKMESKFEKANEIYFRLGIIHKQQLKHDQALECFRYILQKPPRPLSQGDIWFQIGHVYELQKEFNSAKEAYERVLKETPSHPKALQQLGWLYHSNQTMGNQEIAINYLMRSIDSDPTDGQTWYLLGRCYMAQQQYRKAYDAYQQAVYRDGRNPTFWCSIGVLYYQINQYRDALDAYSRAIRLNPYLSEVWYDLGTLYESCNQIQDSLDAYQRAAELDPGNKHIQQRLTALHASQNNSKGEPEKELKNDNHEQEKIPMTLEPRASHVGGEPSRAPRMVPQNIPSVPDLVDLSLDNDKRTLPSSNDLRSRLENSKSNRTSEFDKFNQDQRIANPEIPTSPIEDSKDREENGSEKIMKNDNNPIDEAHKPKSPDLGKDPQCSSFGLFENQPPKLIDPSEQNEKTFKDNIENDSKEIQPISSNDQLLGKKENSSFDHSQNSEITSEDSAKERTVSMSNRQEPSTGSLNSLMNCEEPLKPEKDYNNDTIEKEIQPQQEKKSLHSDVEKGNGKQSHSNNSQNEEISEDVQDTKEKMEIDDKNENSPKSKLRESEEIEEHAVDKKRKVDL
jgi:tetratricopeptide (TPR) repeat protein